MVEKRFIYFRQPERIDFNALCFTVNEKLALRFLLFSGSLKTADRQPH
ncbi:MAG: hypothetical protein J6W29_07810 [Neisseriaceae bacterium]|nr:hypothetical protein [Neisseriaceae bacterium]MBO7555663.1 hypothetical protein [Neisseriaceae bacterium]MBP5790120.1 hypothetical protein [Neisseriaceae bacterium]MBQ5429822.1 hypothetical protein [Neisseriaceae bacterium]